VKEKNEIGDAGALIAIDTGRLRRSSLSSDDITRVELILVSSLDFLDDLSSCMLPGFYVSVVNSYWNNDSFNSNRCRNIPVEAGYFCYRDPTELDISEIYSWGNRADFLEISRDRDRYGNKMVFRINLTEKFKRWFSSGNIPGSFKLELIDWYCPPLFSAISQGIPFYGRNEHIPSLSSGLMIYFRGNAIESECRDGICDLYEECPDDCSLSGETNPPTLSISVNPERDSYDINDVIRVGATAHDVSGIGRIILKLDDHELCDVSNTGHCTYDLDVSRFGTGRHLLLAMAEDTYGNSTGWISRSIWFGSRSKPIITLEDVPEKIYPGQEYSFKVHVTDQEGILRLGVHVGTPSDENRFYQEEFIVGEASSTNQVKDYRKTITFSTCKAWPDGESNPYYTIKVSALDIENLVGSLQENHRLHYPLQAKAGFIFHNQGKMLTYPEYALTFGKEDVYITFSICGRTALVPDECWDNWLCDCYTADPDSISSLLDKLGWIGDKIRDWMEETADGDFRNYFGVENRLQLGIPSPLGLLYYEVYRIAGQDGTCTGFTSNALKIYKDGNQAANEICNGACNDVAHASWDNASFHIGARQGAVLSAEFLGALVDRYDRHTRRVVAELQRELNAGRHPGLSIIGFPDASDCEAATGHTLLVDFLMDMGNGIYRAYVYDSNRPEASGLYDSARYITIAEDINYCTYENLPYVEIDTNNNNFSFFLSGRTEWTRGCINMPIYLQGLNGQTEWIYGAVIMTLPENLLLREEYTLPLSPEGIFMIFAGNADITVEDEENHSIGVKGSGGIPGAAFIPLPQAGRGNSVIILPSDKNYKMHVNGISNRKPTLAMLTDKNVHFALKGDVGFSGKIDVSPLSDGVKLAFGSDTTQNMQLMLLSKKNEKFSDFLNNPNELAPELANKNITVTDFNIIKGAMDNSILNIWVKKNAIYLESANRRTLELNGLHLMPVSSETRKKLTFKKSLDLGEHQIFSIASVPELAQGVRIEEVSEIPQDYMPLPAEVKFFQYEFPVEPVVSNSANGLMPFTPGDIRNGKVSLKLELPAFEEPVDLYLGIYAPAYDPNEVFIIGEDGNLHALNSEGLLSWKQGVVAPLKARFFGDIPVGSLKSGAYTLYTLVIKSGADITTSPFYLWATTFHIGQ